MNKYQQYEYLKRQIVAKDWKDYEDKVKKIIKELKI
jgi:hypothetical protein